MAKTAASSVDDKKNNNNAGGEGPSNQGLATVKKEKGMENPKRKRDEIAEDEEVEEDVGGLPVAVLTEKFLKGTCNQSDPIVEYNPQRPTMITAVVTALKELTLDYVLSRFCSKAVHATSSLPKFQFNRATVSRNFWLRRDLHKHLTATLLYQLMLVLGDKYGDYFTLISKKESTHNCVLELTENGRLLGGELCDEDDGSEPAVKEEPLDNKRSRKTTEKPVAAGSKVKVEPDTAPPKKNKAAPALKEAVKEEPYDKHLDKGPLGRRKHPKGTLDEDAWKNPKTVMERVMHTFYRQLPASGGILSKYHYVDDYPTDDDEETFTLVACCVLKEMSYYCFAPSGVQLDKVSYTSVDCSPTEIPQYSGTPSLIAFNIVEIMTQPARIRKALFKAITSHHIIMSEPETVENTGGGVVDALLERRNFWNTAASLKETLWGKGRQSKIYGLNHLLEQINDAKAEAERKKQEAMELAKHREEERLAKEERERNRKEDAAKQQEWLRNKRNVQSSRPSDGPTPTSSPRARSLSNPSASLGAAAPSATRTRPHTSLGNVRFKLEGEGDNRVEPPTPTFTSTTPMFTSTPTFTSTTSTLPYTFGGVRATVDPLEDPEIIAIRARINAQKKGIEEKEAATKEAHARRNQEEEARRMQEEEARRKQEEDEKLRLARLKVKQEMLDELALLEQKSASLGVKSEIQQEAAVETPGVSPNASAVGEAKFEPASDPNSPNVSPPTSDGDTDRNSDAGNDRSPKTEEEQEGDESTSQQDGESTSQQDGESTSPQGNESGSSGDDEEHTGEDEAQFSNKPSPVY